MLAKSELLPFIEEFCTIGDGDKVRRSRGPEAPRSQGPKVQRSQGLKV